MNSPRIIVNAANCHIGGGRTLLNGFLKGLKSYCGEVIVYVDARFIHNIALSENVTFIKVNRFKRYKITLDIKKRIKPDDIILYFGNLPPFSKIKSNNVYLMLSSRFYVDRISFKGFKLKSILTIGAEKLYFKMFIKNIDHLIVQTTSMKNLVLKTGFDRNIFIWPFHDLDILNNSPIHSSSKKDVGSFIYVASLVPYKNHQRLLEAWKILKNENLNPKLYLTVDSDNALSKWIISFVKENKLNVSLLFNLSRNELLSYYEKSDVLIYPSLFEAYGLPLIEAKSYNLKVIAADLDYCWDFIHPDGWFNPVDVNSISRAIKRYLMTSNNLDKVLTPTEFINNLTLK